MLRKPVDLSIEETLKKHQTGVLHIDACRIGTSTRTNSGRKKERSAFGNRFTGTERQDHDYGRWPANLILQGEEVWDFFDAEVAATGSKGYKDLERPCQALKQLK